MKCIFEGVMRNCEHLVNDWALGMSEWKRYSLKEESTELESTWKMRGIRSRFNSHQ